MNQAPTHLPADILIVDDTPANLRLLTQLLSRSGYSVRAVTSGERALESAGASTPSLVLLDIRMPGMDGIEVCRRLKGAKATRDVPVLFISALDEVQDKVQAFEAGGQDYITKPFQVEEVLARVETHLHLHNLQQQLEEGNRRLERELQLAGRVQSGILPAKMPRLPGWQVAACLRPARQTSGDFYDFFPLPGGRLGILAADVVDKGVAAAMMMMVSWNTFDTYASQFPESPAEVLAAANRRLLHRLEDVIFLTAFYGILEPQTGRLLYANAGHVPPLHIPPGGSGVERLSRTGLPLGGMEDSSWGMASTMLQPGDSLVIYTDGVTDAQSPLSEAYGEERFLASVRTAAGQPADGLCRHILDAVSGFAGDAPQYDDITLVTVTRDQVP